MYGLATAISHIDQMTFLVTAPIHPCPFHARPMPVSYPSHVIFLCVRLHSLFTCFHSTPDAHSMVCVGKYAGMRPVSLPTPHAWKRCVQVKTTHFRRLYNV